MGHTNNKTKDKGGKGATLVSVIHHISTMTAAAAGIIVLGVAAIVTISVTLRTLGLGGIKGDFEIVEFGAGMAAFLFLPYCQLRSSHVMVDLFSSGLPRAGQNFLDHLWELVFAVVWGVVAWRLYLGGVEMLHYGDKSIMLRMPMWVLFVPAVLASAFSAIVALARVVWGDKLALHQQGVIE